MNRVLSFVLAALVLACEGPSAPPSAEHADRHVASDWLGGFEPGATSAELRAACEGAGHRWNAFDEADEAPLVQAWVASGRVARCSGLAHDWAWGDVLQVNFALYRDRLVGMTAYVDGDPGVPRAELERVAVQQLPGPSGRVVYLLERDPQGYAPASVSLAPPAPAVAGARFGLTYTSRAGMDAPPLPSSEEAARVYLEREAEEGRALEH